MSSYDVISFSANRDAGMNSHDVVPDSTNQAAWIQINVDYFDSYKLHPLSRIKRWLDNRHIFVSSLYTIHSVLCVSDIVFTFYCCELEVTPCENVSSFSNGIDFNDQAVFNMIHPMQDILICWKQNAYLFQLAKSTEQVDTISCLHHDASPNKHRLKKIYVDGVICSVWVVTLLAVPMVCDMSRLIKAIVPGEFIHNRLDMILHLFQQSLLC